jgi:4-carboxymuconolactone decarboxylase
MTDSYHEGLDALARTGGTAEGALNRLAEVSPDLARMAIAFPYGEVFSRPALDLRTRELLAVAATSALGSAVPQLRTHVAAALHLGWSQAEVIEALIQTAVFAGFPAALSALTECHDMLVVGGDHCTPCQSTDSADGQACPRA